MAILAAMWPMRTCGYCASAQRGGYRQWRDVIDFAKTMPYSIVVEANGYGAVSFPPHVTTDSLLGKVPSVCGLTSRRSPRQRTAARGGHFAMKYIPLTNAQNAIVDDEEYDAMSGYR